MQLYVEDSINQIFYMKITPVALRCYARTEGR